MSSNNNNVYKANNKNPMDNLYNMNIVHIQAKISVSLFKQIMEACFKLGVSSRSRCVRALLTIGSGVVRGLKRVEADQVVLNISNLNLNVNIDSTTINKNIDIDVGVLKQQITLLKDENKRLKEINETLKREIERLKREVEMRKADIIVRIPPLDKKAIANNLRTVIDLIERGLNDKAVMLLTKLISILDT